MAVVPEGEWVWKGPAEWLPVQSSGRLPFVFCCSYPRERVGEASECFGRREESDMSNCPDVYAWFQPPRPGYSDGDTAVAQRKCSWMDSTVVNCFSSTRLSKLSGRHTENYRSTREADLYSHFILEIHSGP